MLGRIRHKNPGERECVGERGRKKGAFASTKIQKGKGESQQSKSH